MCGIAGIVGYSNIDFQVDRDELLRIRDQMKVRGPDGAGIWISSDQRVGFAHRRLSIIDLSNAGAQPMLDRATGNRIVFNGEIYNFQELRAELNAAGYVFCTSSDTEVLLKLYAEYGVEMLRRLRGMYAFAIWDAKGQSAFLARDPIGIKPLYYSNDGAVFRFASQVKALLAGGAIDTSPEPAGHVGFYTWGAVPEPYTLYKDICALPPGKWLRIERGRGVSSGVFDGVSPRLIAACEHPKVMPSGEALELLGNAVRESVREHLQSDVPVGVFLSSGLDSAMIAASAANISELRTITLGFDEFVGTDKDEAVLAQNLALQLGAHHRTVRIGLEDFRSDRGRIVEAMDQPSIDGVNTWFVAKAAASCGLKVALSGIGGDELFASYPSFSQLPRISRLVNSFAGLAGAGKAFRLAIAPLLGRAISPKYAGIFEYGTSLSGLYLLRRGLYMPWELPEVMDREMAREGWRKLNAIHSLDGVIDKIDSSRLAISALEMSLYMKNQLLRDSDWAGMAHSLEIRVPLADIELLSVAATIFAASPKMSKPSVAKVVAKQLSPDFIKLPKKGFSVPVRIWQERDAGTAVSVLNERGLRPWARWIMAQFGF